MANTPQRKYFSLTTLKKALSSTFSTLFSLSKQLSPLWQKLPTKFPKSQTAKKYLVPLLCCSLLMPAFVSAKQDNREGMFDSLLRIILPFYKKEPAPTTDTSADDMDEIPSVIDDGSDDDYVIEEIADDKSTKKTLDLPSVLLDDTLIADDSTAMLGEPDLLALLSAEFSADRGNIKEALTIYKAESFKKNATNVFERALSLSIEYEEPNQSLAFATAWQKQNQDHIPAWFYVAHLALKAGDYNQASQTLAMILNYDATADLTQILTGIIPDDPDSQRKLFNALTAVGDNNPAISVLRAGLLMRLGDYEPALLHVDTALSKDPTNLSYITLKIDLLKLSNKDDKLWQFVRAKRKQLPMHKELHLYEIHHLIEKGDLKSAWQLLQIANKSTKDPEIILLTALTGLDIGEYAKAERILLPLLNNSDYQSRANYYLGVSHEMRGNINKAREYYEKVKDYEHVLDARTKVVGFYLVNDEVDKAIATLIRLRDEYKIYATDSYLLQAEILMRQNEKESALNLLTSANRENPDDDRLLFASYKLLENELSNDDKRETLNKLISIDPYNHEYLLSDAKLRLLQNPGDTDALKVATTISKISESDPNYDEQLQFDALMLLANHALNQQDYKSVIAYIKTPYQNTHDLNAGILLLKAYQGLNENDKVTALLDELKSNTPSTPNLTSTHQEKVAN
ncbi:tetratricopeptide repeat protein [Moraxella oblonga]|uniref:tetratricopeptide repeat protein n=1 Tax=Moraxella oblonga TaxID=200413 RepID=UPI000829A8E5|nr:tetratricopeptide repeat protein [Moraxella oblonga]